MISRRCGIPNDTLLKPPVMWMSGPKRSRMVRMASRQWLPNSMSTEIGNTSGSTKMSAASIPLPSAALMMRVALSARSPAPAGMPDSPAAVTTTRVSNRFTSSSTSIRSRDAEFISGRPARPASTTSSPVRIVSLLEESIDSGVEPVSCTMPASHAMACCCSTGLSDTSSTFRSR